MENQQDTMSKWISLITNIEHEAQKVSESMDNEKITIEIKPYAPKRKTEIIYECQIKLVETMLSSTHEELEQEAGTHSVSDETTDESEGEHASPESTNSGDGDNVYRNTITLETLDSDSLSDLESLSENHGSTNSTTNMNTLKEGKLATEK